MSVDTSTAAVEALAKRVRSIDPRDASLLTTVRRTMSALAAERDVANLGIGLRELVISRRGEQLETAEAERDAAVADVERLREALVDANHSVVAFCAPWAVTYAREHGLADGFLFARHYDILAEAGARMTDFTRVTIGPAT